MKVAVIGGSRPELIKLAPVCWQLEKSTEFELLLCLTGQHEEQTRQLAAELELNVHTMFNLGQRGDSVAHLTGLMLPLIDDFLEKNEVDLTVVQGDTASTFAASLSSFFRGIPVAHVEAGLRTWDLRHPFPEEAIRRMVTIITSVHFAPTTEARDNLISDGVSPGSIHVVGNTVVDTLRRILPLSVPSGVGKYRVLMTAHRRENWQSEIQSLTELAKKITSDDPKIQVDWVLHPNPMVSSTVQSSLRNCPRITLHPPLEYRDFLGRLSQSSLVITDSGGIQEEAVSLGIPTLVAREKTERPEGITSGVTQLLARNMGDRVAQVREIIRDSRHGSTITPQEIYGDGNSGLAISTILHSMFPGRPKKSPSNGGSES